MQPTVWVGENPRSTQVFLEHMAGTHTLLDIQREDIRSHTRVDQRIDISSLAGIVCAADQAIEELSLLCGLTSQYIINLIPCHLNLDVDGIFTYAVSHSSVTKHGCRELHDLLIEGGYVLFSFLLNLSADT